MVWLSAHFYGVSQRVIVSLFTEAYMAKGLIDIAIDSIFDTEWHGRHGEKLTERELKLLSCLAEKAES